MATPSHTPMEVKAIVEEMTRYLNLEKLLPGYRYTVTCACLYAIRRLQVDSMIRRVMLKNNITN
jgi:transcription initiation factor TFIID subunit 2